MKANDEISNDVTQKIIGAIRMISSVVDTREQERLDLIQRLASWTPEKEYSLESLIDESINTFWHLNHNRTPQMMPRP